MGHVRAVPGEAGVPVTPGSRGAPPGQGGTDSPRGAASTCASRVCARVCVCAGAAELRCFPPAAREELAEVRKGPYWGKNPDSVESVVSRALPHSWWPGEAESPAEGGAFLPARCSSGSSGRKQLRFEAQGRLTPSSDGEQPRLRLITAGW